MVETLDGDVSQEVVVWEAIQSDSVHDTKSEAISRRAGRKKHASQVEATISQKRGIPGSTDASFSLGTTYESGVCSQMHSSRVRSRFVSCRRI